MDRIEEIARAIWEEPLKGPTGNIDWVRQWPPEDMDVRDELMRQARAAYEVMASSDGEVGAKMRKVRGYSFNGEVRAAFTNRAGQLRYVCELEGENGGGMLHIFAPDQIEVTQPAQAQSHSPPLSG